MVGGALWWTGALSEYLAARPADLPGRSAKETPGSGATGSGATGSGATGNGSVSVAMRNPANGGRVAPPKPAMSEVVGTVVDRRGWPVVAARVRLLGVGGSEAVETDASGRFRIRGPSAVNRLLKIEAPGLHAPLAVRGSVEDLALVMQDPMPWAEAETARSALAEANADDLLVGEGWVRDHAGNPAVGASVMVRETGASTRCDEQGRFIVPLSKGSYTLVAWNTAGEIAVTDTTASPRKQGKLPLPELQLAQGYTLRGRLRDDEGQSVVDASIVVDNAGVSRTVRSEQGGLFVLPGIVSGDLRVTILPVRGHVGRRTRFVVDGNADLGDVVLARADREPLRITVIDGEGSPQPFVYVVADQSEGLCRACAETDVKGVAVFTGLGSGETRFEVRNTNLEPMQVTKFDAEARRLVVAP